MRFRRWLEFRIAFCQTASLERNEEVSRTLGEDAMQWNIRSAYVRHAGTVLAATAFAMLAGCGVNLATPSTNYNISHNIAGPGLCSPQLHGWRDREGL